MLSIRVDLLTDRYYATAFNDRDRAEWPPHPGRLFSALVATWAYESDPDAQERALLYWLEGLGAPEITCSKEPDVARRQVHIFYVPVNDASIHPPLEKQYSDLIVAEDELENGSNDPKARSKLTKKYDKALANAVKASQREAGKSATGSPDRVDLLPDNRNRQARTFPAVHPAEPSVYFTWQNVDPTVQQVEALDLLLGRLGRLGHSSSFVSASVVAEAPPAVYRPSGDGDVQLRVVTDGLLDALESSYSQHRGVNPRILPSSIATYGSHAESVRIPTGAFCDRWFILGLGSTHFDPTRELASAGDSAGETSSDTRIIREIMLHQSLPWTKALRSAVQHFALDDRRRAYLGGHSSDGNPLQDVHPAFIPLGFVGSEFADGRVRAFAVVPPRDISDDQIAAVGYALRRWSELPDGMRLYTSRRSEAHLQFMTDEDLPPSVRQRTWSAPSRLWTTATPIVLDRFPKGLHSDDTPTRERALDHVRETIRRALTRQGLPDPTRIEINFDGLLRGSAPIRKFIAYRHGPNSTRKPLSVHAVINFASPVRGPLIIGEGRHLGYGLMRPTVSVRKTGGLGNG